jgi:hypothetical protein
MLVVGYFVVLVVVGFLSLLSCFVLLGMKPRALNVLGKALYHLTYTPALFTLVIFGIGSPVYAQMGLDHDPPIYASGVVVMTGTCHHIQLLLVEMEYLNILLGWPQTMILLITASRVAKIAGVSYCALFIIHL